MKKILPIFIITMLSLSCFGNEAFFVDNKYLEIESKIEGVLHGGEPFKIYLRSEGEEGSDFLKSAELIIGNENYSLDTKSFGQVPFPNLRRAILLEDTGINGSYYSLYLPFGKVKKCKGLFKRKARQAQLVLNFTRLSDNDSYVIEAC